LSAVTIGVRRSPIESDLTDRATAALAGAGLDSLEVSFDGRDGTIVGTATSAEASTAVGVVADLEGVRVVDAAAITPAPDTASTTTTTAPDTSAAGDQPPPTPSFSLESSGDTITLRGTVGSQDAAEGIEDAVRRAFPDFDVDNRLKFDEAAAGAPWIEAIPDAVAALEGTAGPRLAVDDGGATVGGQVNGPVDRSRVVRGIGVTGLDVTDELTVATATASPELSDALFSYIAGRTVGFESGSADISPDSHEFLDGIADLFVDPGPTVVVVGHTDDVGDEASNQQLSEARARSVVDYLIAAGVDPEQLEWIGFGESQPIAPNSTEEGRAANRRVEFDVEGS
jgi:OOP family OmpA-OmpF porin